MPTLARTPLLLAALVLCCVTPVAGAQIGSVVRARKLNEVSGGIVGPIARLGYSLAAIGDLNGDGVGDLVAGVPLDNADGHQRGAVLVLFLNADGTVAGQQKIGENVGGFSGNLPDLAAFGIALASPGDLDGDGLQELAVRSDRPASTWILFLNANGTVRAQQTIHGSDPAFGGGTDPGDFGNYAFARGLVAMGDLDGDGLGDLAVGAPGDDDGFEDAGAVWFLTLNRDGSAKAAKKISATSGGFAGNLGLHSAFGQSMANLGDVNGDGLVDLSACAFGHSARRWILFLDANQSVIGTAVLPLTEVFGAIGDLDGDGIQECVSEGFAVRFLAADGHLRKKLLVRPGRNGMPLDPATRSLGYFSVAALGDLDGDGSPELAVSDVDDSETGGAIWILSLARTPVRNGSGANPLVYKELAEPVVGGTWKAVLDCSGHPRGVAPIFGFERPLSGVFLPAGELLVDLGSRRYFQLIKPHFGGLTTFSAAVPPDVSLVDLQIYSQGACGGPPGVRLSNALYLLVGE